jgi:hypothetical protein
MPRAVRWYSTRGVEHRPEATALAAGTVHWEEATVCPADITAPITITVDGGGVTVSQGPKVLFSTPGYGRPTLVAFKNAHLRVRFVAGGIGSGSASHARVEADAKRRKSEARRAVRAARKAAAAAAAVEDECDSDTEDLLRLGAMAKRGWG